MAAHLTSLRLRDFRCYESLACELPEGLTLFTGDNAQGKTSILEAVCLLLRLQSPRTQSPRELIRLGASGFGVAGAYGEHELRHMLNAEGRTLSLDGTACKRSADYLASSSLVVWLGNGDMELVSGAAEARRRYLDFLGGQLYPAYREALRSCEKALRARNALLRRYATPPWSQVDPWTEVLVEHARTLSAYRADLVAQLAPLVAAAHAAVGGSGEVLSMSYQPGSDADLRAQLAALREEETRRRLTCAGPQRDEVTLLLGGLPAGKFASEGQQRTIALACKLAQPPLLRAHRGVEPLILIDDIFGELDVARRNALLAALPSDAQMLVTTTHADWIAADLRPASHWRVAGRDVHAVG